MTSMMNVSENNPNASQEEIAKAAKEFESYFLGYVFQMAYESVPKSEFLDQGLGGEFYQSMFMQQLASGGSKGLGLADQITHKMQQRLQNEQNVAPVEDQEDKEQAIEFTGVF